MSTVAAKLNQHFAGQSAAAIVLKTALTILFAQQAGRVLAPGQLWKRMNAAAWSVLRTLAAPIVRKKLEAAKSAITFPTMKGEKVVDRLPAKGLPAAEVVARAAELKGGLDRAYEKGGFSGAVYHGGQEHTAMVNRVMELYQWTNPLHVDVFGAARKMEAEIVAMVLRMYGGDARPGSCGAVTSGGTESIGMAVKTYRDWGRAVKGIAAPNIVAPLTAHPAFDKATAYYGVELIKVPVGPSGRVDVAELAKYINYNTVAIVGSSPTFPHGTIDPIAELAELAYSRGIGMHVDACLGGFIVPFMREAGFADTPIVDFRNRGVTTISADTHKYGFAPKGTSCVLYGSQHLRSFQYFATADWPGGVYASPGAAGSRAGNVIAGTWAAMLSLGQDGYVDTCRRIVQARIRMTDGLQAMGTRFRILGDPQTSVFGFASDELDVYLLSDGLKARGWMLNPLQFPAGLQFSVTLLQTLPGVTDRFLADVKEISDKLIADVAAAAARNGGKSKVNSEGATLYGSQQRVADRSLINEVSKGYLDGYYDWTRPASVTAA